MFIKGQNESSLRKSLKILLRSFLLVCVVITYGGGSAWVQGVAWISMLPSHISESESIGDGIEQVLNGENSCALCVFASKLRAVETKSPAEFPTKEVNNTDFVEKIYSERSIVCCVSPPVLFVSIEQDLCHELLSILMVVDIPPPDFA